MESTFKSNAEEERSNIMKDKSEVYDKTFREIFELNASDQLDGLAYQAIELWDSVGHMALMAEFEDLFNIEIDIDDIIDFSSYEEGKRILGKYGIDL